MTMRSENAASRLQSLTEINARDLLTAFGLDHRQRGHGLFLRACRRPARRFARQVLAYDAAVGAGGLRAGGAWVLQQFVGHTTFSGQEHVPRAGPLLIVANHPGLWDAPALFAALPRDDLQVIAADREFLRALPHTMRHLCIAGETAASRLGALRAGVRHLRHGGALLTFPAGQIEPDPAVLPGAVASLDRWPGHIKVFPRLVPDLMIVPAIVTGVISPAALRHPLRFLRRAEKDRRWLAATLQVLFKRYQHTHVRVTFGVPVCVADYGGDAALATCVVMAEARRLIEQAEQAGKTNPPTP